MMITLFCEDARIDRSILAANLAAKSALLHRKIALIDATSAQYTLNWGKLRSAGGTKPKLVVFDASDIRTEMEYHRSYLRTHYQDIIVDADGADALTTDAALIAAQILVIPAWFRQGGANEQERLIRRLEDVRLFNSGLRILVVDVRSISAGSDAGKRESDIAADFARKTFGATLAKTVIHERLDARHTFDAGLSVFDESSFNAQYANEISSLRQEIQSLAELPALAPSSLEVSHAIQRRFRTREAVS